MAKKIKVTKKTDQLAIRETDSLEAMRPWVRDMNPEQLAAIMHDDGPCRLLAAAGSGKTRVAVHRIVRLVAEGCDPKRICLLTFSKKAADEMEGRAGKLGVPGIRVGTWHRLTLAMLREEGAIDDGWEVGELPRGLLKDVLGYRDMKWDAADANLVDQFISKCKAHLDDPRSDGARARAQKMFGAFAGRALEAFFKINEELERRAFLTYDDYLVKAAELLEDPETRAKWSARFDHFLQDEGQDENPAQKHIMRMLACDPATYKKMGDPCHLAPGVKSYMMIGDVYQAIYGFREATPDTLARFEEEWPGAMTYWLPRNYRSGDDIIKAANAVVMSARVPGIDPREMVPSRDFAGTVLVQAAEDLDDEAARFAERVKSMRDLGEAGYGDHCALYRCNAQSRALEEALLSERIPYVVVGGVSFYERKEVRSLLAYLRLADGRGDEAAVGHCINAPFRFLGKAFVEKVQDRAEEMLDEGKVIDWAALVREVCRGPGIQYRQRESAEEWAAMIEGMKRDMRDGGAEGATAEMKIHAGPNALLESVVKRTRYLEWLKRDEGTEMIENSTVSNVRELLRVASRFSTTGALLDYIDETIRAARRQREDKQAGGDRVLLMNTHRSKGLEWKHVFIATFNEQVFPHVMGDPEEERRLAYVAITRARDSLVISHVRRMTTRAGIRDALPSPFVGEVKAALGLTDAGYPVDGPVVSARAGDPALARHDAGSALPVE